MPPRFRARSSTCRNKLFMMEWCPRRTTMIDTSDLMLTPKSEDYIWTHLRSKCLVPLTPKGVKKRDLIDELWADVERGRYSPREVHGFLTTPKGKGVPRYVPVFQAADYVLFFACAEAI